MDAFSKEFCSFTVNSSIPNPSSSSSSPISLDPYKEPSPNQCRRSPFDHLLGGSPSLGFEGDSPGINDSFSATLKFIGEVLLEEEDKPDQKNPFYHHPHHPGEPDSIREVQQQVSQFRANKSKGKRNRLSEFGYGIREDEEEEEGEGFRRGNKHMAPCADDCAPAELFDREFHWDNDSDDFTSFVQTLQSIDQNNNNININISDDEEEEDLSVDFLTLLTKCARAVESNDRSASGKLLGQLRRRSSPTGDPTQRLAHYFANGLQTRLAGGPTTAAEFLPIGTADMSPSDILKAYQLHVTTCPFFRMSFCYANSTIRRLAAAAPRIHIIDFGILFGFQWPGLIQRLSQRPGGPPTLRITGIELPQPPEKSEETRRRLLDYCARFNVPAELHVISRRWEDIKFNDLGVRVGDLVVANCMNRMRHVSDAPGTAGPGSARDAVLTMIRRARPAVFVHGVVSGDYNAAGLAERAAGAAGHFGPLFEAMEECGGDRHREMFERAVYGRYLENAVACEGPARVERPETYRQWEGRIARAGFAQLPLDPHIFEAVRNTVRSSYNAGFTVERDGKWLVQGWKGKRLYALSCWKPIYN